jgi:hypothetical protein
VGHGRARRGVRPRGRGSDAEIGHGRSSRVLGVEGWRGLERGVGRHEDFRSVSTTYSSI